MLIAAITLAVASGRPAAQQQRIKRTDLLKLDLAEVNGSQMNGAEKLAATIARRAQELELARSEADQKLKTLAAAVEGTFREFPSVMGSPQAAA